MLMLGMRGRMACCSWRDRGSTHISFDFDNYNYNDQTHRMMTYDGLESCILGSQSYTTGSVISRENGCPTDSYDEETICSSSNDAFGSSFRDLTTKRDTEDADEWIESDSPEHFSLREKTVSTTRFPDEEAMKERFAKLLLGEDITGGCKGINSAVAISNAITNLAATVFGELWKLEPLPEERKTKWRKEMDWFLSPANYMVELVPAKQDGTNGRTFEIMTSKARQDIHLNLPALQKLDSMLIEALDSTVGTEFWYAEGNSRGEGKGESARQSKRWWFPSPQVPAGGLSDAARKKLVSQGKLVHQVFKATKSINQDVLCEMPLPIFIQDALPKSGRLNLGEKLYNVVASESSSAEEDVDRLRLKTEHEVLDTINKLEAAAVVWRERIKEQFSFTKSSVRTSWAFMKEPVSEADKIESLLLRIDSLLYQLKRRYPCLPLTFLDVKKIQYGKDVGHLILEAYSRVLGNLAYSISSRIADILQEDHCSNPNSPTPAYNFPSGLPQNGMSDSPIESPQISHSLVDGMNKVDNSYFSDSNPSRTSDAEVSSSSTEPNKSSSLSATPIHSSRIWCIGRDVCTSGSRSSSP